MSFPDKSADSVHSLLALLRSSQDPAGSAVAASASSSAAPSNLPTALSSSGPSSYARAQHPQSTETGGQPPQNLPPVIPSKRQLDDLLSSLNTRPPSAVAVRETSRHLIEPFGPVGQTPSSSRLPYDPQIRVDPPASARSPSASASRGKSAATPPRHRRTSSASASASGPQSPITKKEVRKQPHPRERVDEEGYAEMSFGKALPVLTELLGDQGFRKELKKMKMDQDTLERRLWAKGEKVKGDHERSIQAEKEVAKIARKPITAEKKAEWSKSLSSALKTFYANSQPSIDGLALRQYQRLSELGVPGLGSGTSADDKTRDRVRRILDVLEAGLEE